jgi:hypothetical protein
VSENDYRQPRDLTGSDGPKKSQLTLSQGILKRGDDDDEVDDEVSTTVPGTDPITEQCSLVFQWS